MKVAVFRSAPFDRFEECLDFVILRAEELTLFIQKDAESLLKNKNFEIVPLENGPISEGSNRDLVKNVFSDKKFDIVYVPCTNFVEYDNILEMLSSLPAGEVILWQNETVKLVFDKRELKKYIFGKKHKTLAAAADFFSLALEYIYSIPFLVLSLFVLLKNIPHIASAHHIVVMKTLGFGHTLSLPDSLRRLYPGRRLAVIIFQRSRHNRVVADMFCDVKVIFLPFRLKINLPGFEFSRDVDIRVRGCYSKVLIYGLRRTVKGEVINAYELYRRVEEVFNVRPYINEYMRKYGIKINDRPGWTFFPGWFKLIEKVDTPPIKLPPKTCMKIKGRLSEFTGIEYERRRSCCLYLREKGAGDKSWTNSVRNGSGFDKYEPALEYLVGKGYTVLVTGDKKISEEYIDRFKKRVVCSKWVGVNWELFSLFAASESDFWIGNPGGLYTLPIINRTDILGLEFFPYSSAAPNAWVYFKVLAEKGGRVINYNRLFEEYSFFRDLSGLEFKEFDTEDILSAVKEFCEKRHLPETAEFSKKVVDKQPGYFFLKYTNTVILRSWFELFNGG